MDKLLGRLLEGSGGVIDGGFDAVNRTFGLGLDLAKKPGPEERIKLRSQRCGRNGKCQCAAIERNDADS